MSTTTRLGSPPLGGRARRTMPAWRRRRRWSAWGFVGPFLAVFAVVFVAPIGYSVYLSLYRERLIGGNSFVGLDNYLTVVRDDRFWSSLERVALFLAVQVPVMLGIALLVALAIDSGRLYGTKAFRITVFLPYAVPAVVATLMWGFMYGSRFGLVGSINERFGLSLPDPLAPDVVLVSIGNIVTWEYVGYNMLIFYSALRVVSPTLYEAARIDGAGEWRIIAAIKLPAIRGALVIATIFSIIGSFQLFNEPSVTQGLAPNSISTYYTPNMYAYSLSFSGQEYNYSAAVAIVMGVITMIIAYLVQLRGLRRAGAA